MAEVGFRKIIITFTVIAAAVIELIDTSIARIAEEDLPPPQVLALLDRARPAAVIIGRMFQTKQAIVTGVEQRFSSRLHYQLYPGYVDIYLEPRRWVTIQGR